MSDPSSLPRPVLREAERLSALDSYGIMDTPPEGEFDDLVRVAAQICGVPMALVSLIDDKRQWFKSTLGLEAKETPREIAFCAHAIQQRGVFVIEDATKDARFAQNPLVTGDMHLRFYAGAPLETADGFALGALCVLDVEPRELDADQRFALTALARQVMSQIELRKALSLERKSEERHRRILESALDYGIITMDLTGLVTSWNAGAHKILGWSEEEMRGRPCDDFFTPEDRAANVPEIEMGSALTRGRGSDERWHLRKDGQRFWASGEMMPLTDDEGAPIGFLKILRDRTEVRAAQEALKAIEELAERDRRLLIGEMEHRVKNILMLVQVIVRQSLRAAATPAEANLAIEERLASLARAHDMLTRGHHDAAPIAAIVEAATKVHGGSSDRIRAAGPDLDLTSRAAVGLSMALHELCTNAAKYGALSTDTGRISIDWSITGEGEEAMFELIWREQGGPPVSAPKRQGFGSRLIQASLSGGSDRQSQIEYLPDGVVWRAKSKLNSISDQ